MKDTEVLLQCALPARVRDALKRYADSHGIMNKALQADAVRFLLAHRDKTLSAGEHMTYHRPTKPAVTWNVILSGRLSQIVTTAARTDGVSVRHFLHTALIRYYAENIQNPSQP